MTIPYMPPTEQSKPSRAEARMLAALVRKGFQPMTDEGIRFHVRNADEFSCKLACSPRLTIHGLVYVPDFLFWVDNGHGHAHIVVEVDGATWHDTNQALIRQRRGE